MTPFHTTVRAEGSKGNLRITIPTNIVEQMRATGWQPPGWIRLHVDNCDPVFVVARYPISRPSVTCTLPIWAFPTFKPGQRVVARAEDPTPYRARTTELPTTAVIDWLSMLDDAYFPAQEGETLVLWARHEEPFTLKRYVDATNTSFWELLGMYQAEGSKSVNAPDWTLATSNPFYLATVPPALEALGIPRERQYMEILRSNVERVPTREMLFRKYVNVRCAAERLRPGRGNGACVLHVQKSQPLLRFFKQMLTRIFAPDWQWPSKEAARAYALEWLNGDGGITIDRRSNNIALSLAGTLEEQALAVCALEYGFNWQLNTPVFCVNSAQMCMQLDHATDLAIAGAFKYSMSRARLLWALAQRNAIADTPPTRGRSLTTAEGRQQAATQFKAHLHVEYLRLIHHEAFKNGFNIGEKGHFYPLLPTR